MNDEKIVRADDNDDDGGDDDDSERTEKSETIEPLKSEANADEKMVAEIAGAVGTAVKEDKCAVKSESGQSQTAILPRPDETWLRKRPRHDSGTSYLELERDPNGNGSIVRLKNFEPLNDQVNQTLLAEFFKIIFSEDENGHAYYQMGVVENAAATFPECLSFLAQHYPHTKVTTRSLSSVSNVRYISIGEYLAEVRDHFDRGITGAGPMDQLSIVGTVQEESGGFFALLLDELENNPVTRDCLPWGQMSVLENMNRHESNDGPILWFRPGEQLVAVGADTKFNRKRSSVDVNSIQSLQILPRQPIKREFHFTDRTKAHVDVVGLGPERRTTAAVGVLKAFRRDDTTATITKCKAMNVDGNDHHHDPLNQPTVATAAAAAAAPSQPQPLPQQSQSPIVVKEVISFSARNFDQLRDLLQIDVHEPPATQCTMWINTAKLNQLRKAGITYSTIKLHDNDIYFIPRNVIHQFKTISAASSIAWHVQLKQYQMNENNVSKFNAAKSSPIGSANLTRKHRRT